MAQRKLQNEIERCFKKVQEGVQSFTGIYEKIQQTANPSQKEKQEDALKKEIKKLQRSRDQIKAWAAMSEIKDKKPLLEQRRLIETQMEKFKAVEKEMKTKAYSKEGLMSASKLDPKEKEKQEVCNFLNNMVEELERQIESAEAETEGLQHVVKKKKDSNKSERIAELERMTERHKWHQSKLELLLRALENGSVEAEQVKDLEEGIKYYVESNAEADFMEDEELYDELDLHEEEDLYGMNNDADRVSSQDTQSIQDNDQDGEPRGVSLGPIKKGIEPPSVAARRPSQQLKSPLPALATLHTTLPSMPNGISTSNMKPAPLPTRAPGEPLKYASAAAAAAASDKSGVGIAPLPPPPGVIHQHSSSSLAPTSSASGSRQSATTSPAAVHSLPAGPSQPSTQRSSVTSSEVASANQIPTKSPAPSHASVAAAESSSIPHTPVLEKIPSAASKKALPTEESSRPVGCRKASGTEPSQDASQSSGVEPLTNGDSAVAAGEDESIYHLPSSLADLLESFETTKESILSGSKPVDERLVEISHNTSPDAADAERPRRYKPQYPYPYTPPHFPQEPLAIFDDPRLYNRIDTDALFYAFYYRQGTYQQYLAAKALKSQSWRFHKQYQTWFQRHEEPKSITEEYEQGTYRFFDYESTWMNRRKADFRFAYKFLEDEL